MNTLTNIQKNFQYIINDDNIEIISNLGQGIQGYVLKALYKPKNEIIALKNIVVGNKEELRLL